jgi:hypothetical protein
MVRSRRGASRIGCLLSLLIVAAVGSFGYYYGRAYLDFVRFQDEMKSEAKFAVHSTDLEIKARIVALADSIGLPASAKRVTIRRGPHEIIIYSTYFINIELPLFAREFQFNPSATGKF